MRCPSASRPEEPSSPEEGDRPALGHADGETVGKPLGQRHALDPGLRGEPARRSARGRARRGWLLSTARDDAEDVFGARARVARDLEALQSKAAARARNRPTPNTAASREGGGAEPDEARVGDGACRRGTPRPARRKELPSALATARGTPRRTGRRRPRPWSAADRPVSRFCSRQSTTSLFSGT